MRLTAFMFESAGYFYPQQGFEARTIETASAKDFKPPRACVSAWDFLSARPVARSLAPPVSVSIGQAQETAERKQTRERSGAPDWSRWPSLCGVGMDNGNWQLELPDDREDEREQPPPAILAAMKISRTVLLHLYFTERFIEPTLQNCS